MAKLQTTPAKKKRKKGKNNNQEINNLAQKKIYKKNCMLGSCGCGERKSLQK